MVTLGACNSISMLGSPWVYMQFNEYISPSERAVVLKFWLLGKPLGQLTGFPFGQAPCGFTNLSGNLKQFQFLRNITLNVSIPHGVE